MNHFEMNGNLESSLQQGERSIPKLIKRNIRAIKLVGMSVTWFILLIIFLFAYDAFTTALTDVMSGMRLGTFAMFWALGSFIVLAYLFKTYKRTRVRKKILIIQYLYGFIQEYSTQIGSYEEFHTHESFLKKSKRSRKPVLRERGRI